MTEKDLRSPTVRVEGLPALEDLDFEKWLTSLSIRLTQVMVVRDRAGRSKFYGFVVFETREQAEVAAQTINGRRLRNRIVSATVSQDPPQRVQQRVA